MKKIHYKLLILGSGPAGYTAAIYAARANLNPCIITGLEQGGQLMLTTDIENWPGYYKKTTGKDLMNNMFKHVKKLNVKIIFDNIKNVNFSLKPFKLTGENNKYTCNSLIIATGASAKYLNIVSEKKFIGNGISVCATCDGFFYKNKIVAIIGGGNVAVEDALYLSSFVKKIIIIHRKNIFKAESILINRLKKKKNIKIYFLNIVKKIIGKKNIKGLIIENVKNNKIKKILLNGLFIAIGHTPNTSIFKNYINLTKNGYIKTFPKKNKSNISATNIKGIFAAGDVQDSIYRQAITSAGSGCIAALDSQKFLENFKI